MAKCGITLSYPVPEGFEPRGFHGFISVKDFNEREERLRLGEGSDRPRRIAALA